MNTIKVSFHWCDRDWYAIPSAPNYYASSDGLILSMCKTNPLIMTPIINPRGGYQHIFIHRRKRFVHHLVLEAFGYSRPYGYECRHLDGNPANNDISNLRWGTAQENADDKKLHGTNPIPHLAKDTKLFPLDIPVIRQMSRDGYSARRIAEVFQTSHTTILKIIRNERWIGY